MWARSNSSPRQAPRRPSTARETARSWGRLRLLERIGEGAFGEVYRAYDPRLNCEVALKVLRTDTPPDDQQIRMMRECRNLARVRHPNIVAVHGAQVSVRRTGFWMELVRGTTLAELLRWQGPFAAEDTAVIGRELCRAVSAVHDAGLVHGDIKAQNVMREQSGRIVLLDFGSSVSRDEPRTPGDRLTGTLQYLAPEILSGGDPSIATDIYSLGVLLFYLATGTYPVQAASMEELKQAHSNGRVRRLTDLRALLPHAFVAAIEGATRPADSRFRTAAELFAALTEVRPPLVRPADSASCGCAIEPSAAIAFAETATSCRAPETTTMCFA